MNLRSRLSILLTVIASAIAGHAQTTTSTVTTTTTAETTATTTTVISPEFVVGEVQFSHDCLNDLTGTYTLTLSGGAIVGNADTTTSSSSSTSTKSLMAKSLIDRKNLIQSIIKATTTPTPTPTRTPTPRPTTTTSTATPRPTTTATATARPTATATATATGSSSQQTNTLKFTIVQGGPIPISFGGGGAKLNSGAGRFTIIDGSFVTQDSPVTDQESVAVLTGAGKIKIGKDNRAQIKLTMSNKAEGIRVEASTPAGGARDCAVIPLNIVIKESGSRYRRRFHADWTPGKKTIYIVEDTTSTRITGVAGAFQSVRNITLGADTTGTLPAVQGQDGSLVGFSIRDRAFSLQLTGTADSTSQTLGIDKVQASRGYGTVRVKDANVTVRRSKFPPQ